MAEKRWFHSPIAGIDVVAATDITLLEFALTQYHRGRIHAIKIALPSVDTALVAQNFRVVVSSAAGSGNSTTGIITEDVDAGAPTVANEAIITAGHSRTGFTEGASIRDLLVIAPQNNLYYEEFVPPIIVPENARTALICDSTVNIDNVRVSVLLEV